MQASCYKYTLWTCELTVHLHTYRCKCMHRNTWKQIVVIRQTSATALTDNTTGHRFSRSYVVCTQIDVITCRQWSIVRSYSSDTPHSNTSGTGSDTSRRVSVGRRCSRDRSTASCSCPCLCWSGCTDGPSYLPHPRQDHVHKSWATSGSTAGSALDCAVASSLAVFYAACTAAAVFVSVAAAASANRCPNSIGRPWLPIGSVLSARCRPPGSLEPLSSMSSAHSCPTSRGTCSEPAYSSLQPTT